jgi:hypothetical protein
MAAACAIAMLFSLAATANAARRLIELSGFESLVIINGETIDPERHRGPQFAGAPVRPPPSSICEMASKMYIVLAV